MQIPPFIGRAGEGLPDWARLGLSANPFENVEPGAHLDWVDVPAAALEAVSRRPFRVELVGPKGAGKSSILRALLAGIPGSSLLYLSPGDRLRVPELVPGAAVAVDEADRASRRALRGLGRAAAGARASLLLGTHGSLAGAIGGEWLTIELSKVTSLAWVQRRVDAVKLPGHTPPDFREIAQGLWAEFSGVNYGVLRALYELAESAARGQAIDASTLRAAVARARADPTLEP